MASSLRGQVKSAVINFAASGDNTVVAAIAGKLISIVGLSLVVGAATNLTFKDGAANLLSGAIPMTANGSIVFDEKSDFEWYYTSNVANAFIINSSAAVQVSGTVYYVQV